ncbi:MAG: AraC family transcriptional regulator [Pseudomonadota bacterium]
MTISPPDVIRAKLEDSGKRAHFLHVTQDGQVMICRASNSASGEDIMPLPLLFLHLCLQGGGPIRIETNLQTIHGEVAPGSIGVIPPNSIGSGTWPEMTAISIGMSLASVQESFGDDWPEKLRPDMTSRIFRDPLVESTMIDIGYARAGTISDAGLIHAAHMIAHQLLDPAADQTPEEDDVAPLGKTVLTRIDQLLDAGLDRHVTVAEMAMLAGISRYHFSRRFKAAIGQSPLQYALRKKLDHAARMLDRDDQSNILDVAQMVGFANPAHFSRAFKKQFGLTPRSWRSR